MVWVNFAASPNFSLYPLSGQALKLHCKYNFNVVLDPVGQNYNAFASTVKFIPTDVTISHVSVNAPFITNFSGFIVGGNLYRAYGALPLGQKSSASGAAATFEFRTITNITGTVLQFSTNTGSAIAFWPSYTADGVTIDATDTVWDMLWSVYDASYIFDALPCVVDTDAPKFPLTYPIAGAYHILSGEQFTALIYDWMWAWIVSGTPPMASNNRSHYRYAWLNTGVLANYVVAPSTVDNQEGVNSGTIKISLSCPTCNTRWASSYIKSWDDLHLLTWTGNVNSNSLTWDNHNRGYTLWFDPLYPYEIEKQVNVTLQAVDNPNELFQTHTWSLNFFFNAPRKPIISSLYPLNGSSNVDWRNTTMIRLYFSDDWAGIDTWTISITIPQIASWAEILMTGYTYSWSDLQIILSGGDVGTGNAWSYLVQFTGKWNFASNTAIVITWFVADLVGNTWDFTMSFVTRPDCAFWWCNAVFQVIGSAFGSLWFTGSLLVVTGTDANTYSPYPYLTGELWDTLMCGTPYSWTVLHSSALYDSTDTSVNGIFYTWEDLYITWLNFVIENGIVIIE